MSTINIIIEQFHSGSWIFRLWLSVWNGGETLLERIAVFRIVYHDRFRIYDLNECDSDCCRLADRILARTVTIPHWFDAIFQYTSAGRQMEAASKRITDYIYKVNCSSFKTFANDKLNITHTADNNKGMPLN